jgi:hypothetical protein
MEPPRLQAIDRDGIAPAEDEAGEPRSPRIIIKYENQDRMVMRTKDSIEGRSRARRDFPLEALQMLAEMGVGLDDVAVLGRVAAGLQGGVPKCCIVFATLVYGRALDAGRHELVAGYRTWMNRSGVVRLDYVPCPRCVVERSFVRATHSVRPADEEGTVAERPG